MQKKSLGLLLTILIACTLASAGTVPRIVKVVHLKNQTGTIGPITLYTPQKAGLFRVSLLIVVTVGNGEFGALCPFVGFTDSVGPGASLGFDICADSETKGDVSSNVGLIESAAGADVTLSVQAISQSAAAYNVDVVIEALPEVHEHEEDEQ